MTKNLFFGFALLASIFAFQTGSLSFDGDAKADNFERVRIIVSACMDKSDSIKIEDGEFYWITTPKRLGSTAYLPGQHSNCKKNGNTIIPSVKIGNSKATNLPMDEAHWVKMVKERTWSEPYEEFFIGSFRFKDLGFSTQAEHFESEILLIDEGDLDKNQETCPDAKVRNVGLNSITISQSAFDYCQFRFTYMYISREKQDF